MKNAIIRIEPLYITLNIDEKGRPIYSDRQVCNLIEENYTIEGQIAGAERFEVIFSKFNDQIRRLNITDVTVKAAPSLADNQPLADMHLILKREYDMSIRLEGPFEYLSSKMGPHLPNEEEALIFYLGVCDAYVVFAIGRQLIFGVQLDLGLISLWSAYGGSSPSQSEELIKLRRHIARQFGKILVPEKPARLAVIGDVPIQLYLYLRSDEQISSQVKRELGIGDIKRVVGDPMTGSFGRPTEDNPVACAFGPLLPITAVILEHLMEDFQLEKISVYP